MKEKLEAGGKLSNAEQAVVSRISAVLGKGAGTNTKVLGGLIAAGSKMLGQLNSNMPAQIGDVGGSYARADARQVSLSQPMFFGASTGMASQVLAHESHHHAVEPGLTDSRLWTGGGQIVSAYGYSSIVRQAELRNNPERMLKIPDAVAFALGFDRDDD